MKANNVTNKNRIFQKSVMVFSVLVFTILLFNDNSFAESSGLYFRQANPGEHILQPELNYAEVKVKDVPAGPPGVYTNMKTKSPSLRIGYEYGINDQFSIGAKTKYTDATSKFDNGAEADQKGLGNIDIVLSGQSKVSNFDIKYGGDLSISHSNFIMEANGDRNNVSGRHMLTPYIGAQTQLGIFTVGGKVHRNFALTDVKTENKATGKTTKSTGEEEFRFELFAETDYSHGTWGFKFGTGSKSDKKDTTTGARSKRRAHKNIDLYGNYRLNESSELLAEIGYFYIPKVTSTHALFGARFSF